MSTIVIFSNSPQDKFFQEERISYNGPKQNEPWWMLFSLWDQCWKTATNSDLFNLYGRPKRSKHKRSLEHRHYTLAVHRNDFIWFIIDSCMVSLVQHEWYRLILMKILFKDITVCTSYSSIHFIAALISYKYIFQTRLYSHVQFETKIEI